MKQLVAWLGGAAFVGALGLCAWGYFVQFGRRAPFTGWSAAAADTALFSAFALHHSVLARERPKALLQRLIPPALIRSAYMWIASLLLGATILFWRTVGGELYDHTGAAAAVHAGIELVGLGLIARATSAINALELAGIRQAATRPDSSGPLQTTGLYRWVRHPLYLGWLLAVWGHAHMTGDRTLFAGITTSYLAAAIPFEERSLVDAFGNAYAITSARFAGGWCLTYIESAGCWGQGAGVLGAGGRVLGAGVLGAGCMGAGVLGA